jgi:hypothetical protein
MKGAVTMSRAPPHPEKPYNSLPLTTQSATSDTYLHKEIALKERIQQGYTPSITHMI